MKPDDAVERTIRNQRHPAWSVWLIHLVCAAAWTMAALAVDPLLPSTWQLPAGFALGTTALLSFVSLQAVIERRPPKRITLGEEMVFSSASRFLPQHIREVHFEADPREDYAEDLLPIRVCQLTIEFKDRGPLRMIVSRGDAGSMREWAEPRGVNVLDPEGYFSGAI